VAPAPRRVCSVEAGATVEGRSDEAGVFLGAPVPAVVPAPLGSAGRGSLPGGLALVMPPAERGQVGVSVVVTSDDVIHIRGRLRTPDAAGVARGAAMLIAAQDAPADLRPVRG
jgi:hypothetical protein